MMQAEYKLLLDRQQRKWNLRSLQLAVLLGAVCACWYYVGLFDAERLGEGIPKLFSLAGGMFPPNFSQAGS